MPDVGAYEASSSYLVASAEDSNDVGTLRTGVGWANVSTNANPEEAVSPLPNSVFFDADPGRVFAKSQTITLLPQLGTLDLSNSTTSEEIFYEPPRGVELSISGGNQVQVFDVLAGVTATFCRIHDHGWSRSKSKSLGPPAVRSPMPASSCSKAAFWRPTRPITAALAVLFNSSGSILADRFTLVSEGAIICARAMAAGISVILQRRRDA